MSLAATAAAAAEAEFTMAGNAQCDE